MAKNKHRWAKVRRSLDPKRFRYVGLPDGRTVVYRGQNAFDWGPLKNVDREALRRLLNYLNGLTGTSIEILGRPACIKWKKEFDTGKHRQDPATPEPALRTGTIAADGVPAVKCACGICPHCRRIAGPAEPGTTAKET